MYNIEITKREIIASVVIAAMMIIIGITITSSIYNNISDKNQEYNTAIKIDNNQDQFEYGMKTNVGNAFVYGKLQAVDTVTNSDIDGEYIYIEWTIERYTMHTRQVKHTTTDSDGNTHTTYETEKYWTWDTIDHDDQICNEVSFCNRVFSVYKFSSLPTHYIDTVYKGVNLRYIYYGTYTEYDGTIYTTLQDNTISDGTVFYQKSLDEAVESAKTNPTVVIVIFWIFWLILTDGCIYGFCYLENRWLE